MGTCPAKDDPNTSWPGFCPNFGADVFYIVLFLGITIVHLVQGVMYRKFYSAVVIMAAIWQTAAYIFRAISIKKPTSVPMYSAWFILILLAPLWTNAYVYMVLGRMVYNFTASAKIFRIPAWRFALYFVLLDIVAFLIQAAGASMASGDNLTNHQIMNGLHVYMGGIGFQLFFIVVFTVVALAARRHMIRDNAPADAAKALLLLNILFAVLVLITVRIIFRLIEYSGGYSHGIPVHEAYQYILDSTLMWIALVLLSVVHAGRIMPGKESNLPSRKTRKAIGKANVKGRATGGAVLPVYNPAEQSSGEIPLSNGPAKVEPNVGYPGI